MEQHPLDPATLKTRTAEEERRDVLAFLRDKVRHFKSTLAEMPAELGYERGNLRAHITIIECAIIGNIACGDHVGAAERSAR